MRFRRPTPLDQAIDEEFPQVATVVKPVPLRATGLPEKNTFIQFPQERGGVAPVGAFTTPANLAPNLGSAFAIRVGGSPVLSASPLQPCSLAGSPASSASPIRTPSTMCGSPPMQSLPQPPGFLRCISDPTGGMDVSAMPAWCHFVSPSHLNTSISGQPLSPHAPAYLPQPPQAPLAPLVQNKMAPGPLLTGPKLPPGAVRMTPNGSVSQRPYLLPAPQLPAVQLAPPAPRVLKFSYTVPGNPVPPAKGFGEISENGGLNM